MFIILRHNNGAWVSCDDGKMEDVVNSLQPGKVFLIGARPGMGKTAFVHKLMNYLPNQPMLPLVYNIPKTQKAPQIHPLEHMLKNMPNDTIVNPSIR